MNSKTSVVVTSISKPNSALRELSKGCLQHGHRFIVIGDKSSPPDFYLEGCDYYDLMRQHDIGFRFPEICPQQHYARKNIGYLIAIQQGTEILIDTDDDNIPYGSFWNARHRNNRVPAVDSAGWINVYQYFTKEKIWPRGFPLENTKDIVPPFGTLIVHDLDCPIQQGLANENPDVDAIFRLTSSLPVSFENNLQIALIKENWCPFNSQNTIWHKDAFPLLYLPAYCSFRMTDIWRSFVAQRIAWENNWSILFYAATVFQIRNEHNLLKDFYDEIPGYLKNAQICAELGKLKLEKGTHNIIPNLQKCYHKLVEMEVVGPKEIPLLNAWIQDLNDL